MELLELITTFQDLGFECEEQLSKRKKNKFESNKEYHYYFKKGEKIISVFKERDHCGPELCPIQGYGDQVLWENHYFNHGDTLLYLLGMIEENKSPK